jgi:RNA polymerase sigma-70 factor (ECF subfamily)
VVLSERGIDWEAVYRAHAPRLRGLIARRVPSGAVEDVLQETFVRAYRSRHRLDTTRPLWPFLATLARRSSIQWYRTHQLEPAVGPVSADERDTVDFPGSDDHLAGYLRARRVVDVLARLTPRHRRILYLHGAQDVGCDVIAAADKLSEKAVRSALDRARANFRSSYGRSAPGSFGLVGLGRHWWVRVRHRVDSLRLEGSERLGALAAGAAVSAVVGVLALVPPSPLARQPTTAATGTRPVSVYGTTVSQPQRPSIPTSTGARPTATDRPALGAVANTSRAPEPGAPPLGVRTSGTLVNTPEESIRATSVEITVPVNGTTVTYGSTVYCDRAMLGTLECTVLRLLPSPS